MKSLILLSVLVFVGCGGEFRKKLPWVKRVDVTVTPFRTMIAVKNGELYDVRLKCAEGYSISKQKVLGKMTDCDTETIDGKVTINLDLDAMHEMAIQLLEAGIILE